MSEQTSAASTSLPAHREEATFKNYNSTDATKYAAYRPSYPPLLIKMVMEGHTSTGGQTTTVLDIGCGPGIATRQIAAFFEHAIGVDAGQSMIETARNTPCYSSTGEQARFEVCGAEEIDKVIDAESVDLITVATAAHWFDMPRFYAAASKVLKPSGTIAMWCAGSWYVDPRTTPNAAEVQSLWTELDLEVLKPFEVRGNVLSRTLYDGLPLPWTVPPDSVSPEVASALTSYDEQHSSRQEFNKDGTPDPRPEFAATKGYLVHVRMPYDVGAKRIGTASQVTRWRQHHKEALEKGEIEDCIEYMMRRTKAKIAEVEGHENRDWLDIGSSMVLLTVKKKA
ncbi:hypothetical protein H2198_003994 [Neophaeococcomyces mojaviensis]|uniref:Uncharacterized protein n=1 Tax=Neophaeococcomyces mojaviensis TaxID=3383035 RepID=A0ACC3A9Y4_9EURO|nr:hypothetical protein H2198_003994 [Knufia sp. JES_112]